MISEDRLLKPECLRPKCNEAAVCRGLCKRCYGIAARMVHRKLITWKTLESKGKALPSGGKVGARRSEAHTWFLN